jgi:RNA polymerase sigma-70 factor, ECF subfamily
MRSRSRKATPDRAEFNALYERHSREVWGLAYARWVDASAALDIVQEVFLRLWKQWQSGEIIHNPRAWLLRVARNLAEDYVKSAFHRNGTLAPQTMTGLASHEPAPLEHMLDQERSQAVRTFLGELPETDRQILTLRYGLDLDSQAIAEMLGINTTAVHMRLSRARQRLAARLNAQGVTGK